MTTIQANVNSRLLTKADRLFPGTLEGRIIEILQNARRAGATKVEITNRDGCITVHDNGRGIDDFAKLIDLGGSGWEEHLESSEDPAGVGLFCLARREVTIRSRGKMVTIGGDGWTGVPVKVHDDPKPVAGTRLSFHDEPWTKPDVDRNAVFTGMEVTVDGQPCPRLPFVSKQAAHYPELGSRIEVCESSGLHQWHRTTCRGRSYEPRGLINFHGQVVEFDCSPVDEHGLRFLVDLTGEPTGIRLMLPARTQIVQNQAYAALNGALEVEAYRYIQRRGSHTLPYKQYLRARELGVELPEAQPTFSAGLLSGDSPQPIDVSMPKGFPLSKCYRFQDDGEGDESDLANAHLLAALGSVDAPFVPVDIHSGYDGYSWAKLPVINKVELKVGETLHEDYLWSGQMSCMDAIFITAHTSDGRVFASPVCMAVPLTDEDDPYMNRILVTTEARERVVNEEIWYHLGGWSDDGDTYDTQVGQFEDELQRFWDEMLGPNERLRSRVFAAVTELEREWAEIALHPEGTMSIRYKDGSQASFAPPGDTVQPAAE